MAPSVVGNTPVANGTSQANGAVYRTSKSGKTPDVTPVTLQGQEHHPLVLASFRCLIADLCQQFGGGHPGGAMGMAAIGVSLWSYVMQYSPHNPSYFNRDRFVLSNGHCCLFQYAFLHLTGYKAMTWDMLKSYHSVLPDSLCPGHPEIEIDGIEVTTGPLGQGVSNAVGLAMASHHLAEVYNRPGFEVVNNMTFCMVGDACLQEGVALEAFSLAGHWKLRRLVVMYDNNQITCDGSVDICNTEDINAKMQACGWDTIDIYDGCYDIAGIVAALETAKNKTEDKPTFINIRTIIGVGSKAQGEASTHGAAFGPDDVRHIKTTFGMDPDQHFVLPEVVKDFFQHKPKVGAAIEADYERLLADYASAHPELAAEFKLRREGQFTADPFSLIPPSDKLTTKDQPGRKNAGAVLNPLAERLPSLMVGTADLTPSVSMHFPGAKPFNHASLQPTKGVRGSYAGRYIHYGIREHAMAGIANGLSAFSRGTILPVTSSFLIFYIYAAPAIRMAALMGLQQIHIATHDSLGAGEDGPTHQPVALPALLRAMPNLLYMRPADAEEAAGAVTLALSAKHSPSIISVSRHATPQYVGQSQRAAVAKGAYALREAPGPGPAAVTIVSCGAEMCIAVAAADELHARHGIAARIVSMPCMRAFAAQPKAYRAQVLRRAEAPVVAVEAYSMVGWERWADAGFGVGTFGKSLPSQANYQHFGFVGHVVAEKIARYVGEVGTEGLAALRAEGFRELNEDNWNKGLEF